MLCIIGYSIAGHPAYTNGYARHIHCNIVIIVYSFYIILQKFDHQLLKGRFIHLCMLSGIEGQ